MCITRLTLDCLLRMLWSRHNHFNSFSFQPFSKAMIIPALEIWTRDSHREQTQWRMGRVSLDLASGLTGGVLVAEACSVRPAASHLHDVFTVLHLECDVLHPIAVLHQVVAHLCGQQESTGSGGPSPYPAPAFWAPVSSCPNPCPDQLGHTATRCDAPHLCSRG